MTTVSGILRDATGAAVPNVAVTVKYNQPVVGYSGGAIAHNDLIFTTSGTGLLTMTGLVAGGYTMSIAMPKNTATSVTTALSAQIVVDGEATQTLEEALVTTIGEVTPTVLALAIAAKDEAEAAALTVLAIEPPYASRAAAEAATIPGAQNYLQLIHYGKLRRYYRDASGTALTTNGGTVKWSPAEAPDFAHWGVVYGATKSSGRWTGTDSITEAQAALDWCSTNRKRLRMTGDIYIPHKAGQNVFALVAPSYVDIAAENGATFAMDFDPAETITGNTYKSYAVFEVADYQTATESTVAARELFRLDKVAFMGLWDDHPAARRQDCVHIQGYERVEMLDVEAEKISGAFMRGDYNGSWLTRNGRYVEIPSGSIVRSRYTSNIVVDGAYVEGTADDAIDVHATDPGPDNPEKAVRSRVTITNCHFFNARIGAVLGAVALTFTNNHAKLCFGGIALMGDTSEGQGALHSNIITGNTFLDVMFRPDISGTNDNARALPTALDTTTQSAAISLGNNAEAGDGTIAAPMRWDATLGRFAKLHEAYSGLEQGAMWSRDSRSSKAGALGLWFVVDGNIIARTLPNVAAASDWGISGLFSHYGYMDIAITDDSFVNNGIVLYAPMKGVSITGNKVTGVQFPIYLDQQSHAHPFEDVTVENNEFFDFERGVKLDANTGRDLGLTIRNNKFNADPYRISSIRTAADGSWSTTSNSLAIAIDVPGARGLVIEGNEFRNCQRVYRNAGTETASWRLHNNRAYGYVVASGFSTSNLGIGNAVAHPVDQITYIDVDMDETAATYDEQSSAVPIPVSYATVIASANGPFYPAGHFIRRTSALTPASTDVVGWQRITAGRAWVLDTDYVEITVTT